MAKTTEQEAINVNIRLAEPVKSSKIKTTSSYILDNGLRREVNRIKKSIKASSVNEVLTIAIYLLKNLTPELTEKIKLQLRYGK